jgi:Glycoside hydrolase 123, catalytic domain
MTRNRHFFIVLCGLIAAATAVYGAQQSRTFKSDPLATTPQFLKTRSETPKLNWWFVDSLTKIFPNATPPSPSVQIPTLYGARNGHVDIQLALRSDTSILDISAVTTVTRLAGRGPTPPVKVYYVGLVPVSTHTPDTPQSELLGAAPGEYPDPLMELPTDLHAGETTSLWITVSIPEGASPGEYDVYVSILSSGSAIAEGYFQVQVYSTTISSHQSFMLTGWYYLDSGITDRVYGFPMFSDQWWQLVANSARVLADYRQNCITTVALDLATPYFSGGQIKYDFSNFDRWVGIFRSAGVNGCIEGYSLMDRPNGSSYPQVWTWQDVSGEFQQQWISFDDPRAKEFLSGFLPQLYAHLKAKGLAQVYFQHILDEPHGPDFPTYQAVADLVHGLMPGVRTIDAVPDLSDPAMLDSSLDIWVPLLGNFNDQGDLIKQEMQSGKTLWYYTALVPRGLYTNKFLDFSLLKVRLLPWIAFREGFVGFLFAGGNLWTDDPFHDVEHMFDYPYQYPPGDTFIVYPDLQNNSIRGSTRFAVLREGVEDFELLDELRSKDPSAAAVIVGNVVTSFTDYIKDPAHFLEIRHELLTSLSTQKAGAPLAIR